MYGGSTHRMQKSVSDGQWQLYTSPISSTVYRNMNHRNRKPASVKAGPDPSSTA